MHVVGQLVGCAECRHPTIAYEFLDDASTDRDWADDSLQVRVEHVEQAGRVVAESLRQAAEAADVGEQDRNGAHDGCRQVRAGRHLPTGVNVCLAQPDDACQVSVAIGDPWGCVLSADQIATSFEARLLASTVAAAAAVPAPLRITAVTPAF